jgi:hypothetical protein
MWVEEETNINGVPLSRVAEMMAELAHECHHYVVKVFDEHPSEEEEEDDDERHNKRQKKSAPSCDEDTDIAMVLVEMVCGPVKN